MDGVFGVVTCFAADFAPKNWAFCNGQVLAISQNQALFSIIGAAFGGDGTTTFALPDLRGRAPVSVGGATGLSKYSLGSTGGMEAVSLNTNNLPSHQHNGPVALQLSADSSDGTITRAVNSYPALYNGGYATSGITSMAQPAYGPVAIGVTGPGQPMNIRAPFLAVNYIICVFGSFPSRN